MYKTSKIFYFIDFFSVQINAIRISEVTCMALFFSVIDFNYSISHPGLLNMIQVTKSLRLVLIHVGRGTVGVVYVYCVGRNMYIVIYIHCSMCMCSRICRFMCLLTHV